MENEMLRCIDVDTYVRKYVIPILKDNLAMDNYAYPCNRYRCLLTPVALASIPPSIICPGFFAIFHDDLTRLLQHLELYGGDVIAKAVQKGIVSELDLQMALWYCKFYYMSKGWDGDGLINADMLIVLPTMNSVENRNKRYYHLDTIPTLDYQLQVPGFRHDQIFHPA